MFTASLTISDLDFTNADDAARALLTCDARPLHVTVTNQHTGKTSDVVVSDFPGAAPHQLVALNAWQVAARDAYGDGDYGHVESVAEAKEVGDTLFQFVMVELADAEGCENAEQAIDRIDAAIADLQAVRDAISAADHAAQLDISGRGESSTDNSSLVPPMGCVIEPHGDGFRYHFDGDDDDDPRVYPTEAAACAAANLIG